MTFYSFSKATFSLFIVAVSSMLIVGCSSVDMPSFSKNEKVSEILSEEILLNSEKHALLLLQYATKKDCLGAGLGSSCLRVCEGDSREKKCSLVKSVPEKFSSLRANSYVCHGGRCLPALIEKAGQKTSLSLFDLSEGGACANKVSLSDVVSRGNASLTSLPISAVIPPEWYGPTCCQDCWAAHRFLGLPCSVDNICCMGECGKDPLNCAGGGGGGGSGGVGGGDSGEDSSCGEPYDVEGASVSSDGVDCLYSGEVTPTMIGGECIDIPTSGIVYDCDGSIDPGEINRQRDIEGSEG